MKLDDLKPADYNPRSMTDRAREGLRASLERFGCVQHIVWNRRTKRVVGGHQRLTALLDLGEKETDVVVVSFTAKEERALNVALNNQAIQGEWTDDLESLLAGIQTDTPDLYGDLLLAELTEDDPQCDTHEVKLKQLDALPPPKMSWVLIGIPTVRFGEITEAVEQIGGIDGTILEMTVSDDTK